MPNIVITQNSFSGGELSPDMVSRYDDAKYAAGALLMKNFIAKPQGTLQKRTGFEFISEVEGNRKARIIPFVHSQNQTMLIEITKDYFKFYIDGKPINGGLENDFYFFDEKFVDLKITKESFELLIKDAQNKMQEIAVTKSVVEANSKKEEFKKVIDIFNSSIKSFFIDLKKIKNSFDHLKLNISNKNLAIHFEPIVAQLIASYKDALIFCETTANNSEMSSLNELKTELKKTNEEIESKNKLIEKNNKEIEKEKANICNVYKTQTDIAEKLNLLQKEIIQKFCQTPDEDHLNFYISKNNNIGENIDLSLNGQVSFIKLINEIKKHRDIVFYFEILPVTDALKKHFQGFVFEDKRVINKTKRREDKYSFEEYKTKEIEPSFFSGKLKQLYETPFYSGENKDIENVFDFLRTYEVNKPLSNYFFSDMKEMNDDYTKDIYEILFEESSRIKCKKISIFVKNVEKYSFQRFEAKHSIINKLLEIKKSNIDFNDLRVYFLSEKNPYLDFLNAHETFEKNEELLNISINKVYKKETENNNEIYYLKNLELKKQKQQELIGEKRNLTSINLDNISKLKSSKESVPFLINHRRYGEEELFDINYIQSSDVVTLVHQNHPPMELRRTDVEKIEFVSVDFTPKINPPDGVTAETIKTSVENYKEEGRQSYKYVVTALSSDRLHESVRSNHSETRASFSYPGEYVVIKWNTVPNASLYNVYRLSSGLYGFVGQTTETIFHDSLFNPDMSLSPSYFENPFNEEGNYPSAVSYFEQRRVFGGTLKEPHTLWMTRVGTECAMSYSIPPKADDRIKVRIASKDASPIRHLVPLSHLLAITGSTEWRVSSASGNDMISPFTISVRPQSYIGASSVKPVLVNNTIIYVSKRGNHIYECGYNQQANGFITSDLSLRSPHLFDNDTVVDLAYSSSPTPIIWAVMGSGKLLGMTYVPEHSVGAWHQHDTKGHFESCAVVPEGNYDALYVVVSRDLGNGRKRFVERLSNPENLFEELSENFLDCSFNIIRKTNKTDLIISNYFEMLDYFNIPSDVCFEALKIMLSSITDQSIKTNVLSLAKAELDKKETDFKINYLDVKNLLEKEKISFLKEYFSDVKNIKKTNIKNASEEIYKIFPFVNEHKYYTEKFLYFLFCILKEIVNIMITSDKKLNLFLKTVSIIDLSKKIKDLK